MGYHNSSTNKLFNNYNIGPTRTASHVWTYCINSSPDHHQRLLLLFCNLSPRSFCRLSNHCIVIFIKMLDQGRICNRELRVYYGTTKFCPYFLRGTNCELSICNYAHFYIPELIH